ncbi:MULTISPECIES: PAS domain-containing sensor histidine kinase [unclassified Olleya]|uniref:PAS domain-containing sensor histidine kinase n=1 Tax=unclassified Olleya TaxID=2615019 RepID=UPI000C300696|nr:MULTISPECIES: PAS domain-containing sensor histidine kinase [unclassified Olleya]AUC76114.1 PAS domain-containing sensor histidine kinase [Olleya sp. Bg11-27]QXP58342.1 PAS domain-containing sensor histidine kinase [Olleya sp. HaHaR_3_96]
MFNNNQEIFEILSEAISEGILIVDENQTIIAVNASTEEMFGYNKDELNNKPLETLIPSNYHKGHGHQFNSYYKNSEKRSMGKGRALFAARKDGSTFPVEVGLNPFNITDKKYVMALVIDITERKNYTDKLEKTVEERTKQLREALETEKELNDLKTKFLSLVSHEFKTPLTGILTSSMLLSKYKLAEQQDKRDKHINTINSKVQYLNNILNDFLSVEKLESGKVNYKFTEFRLSKVVNEVVYNANMLLKEGQKIKYPENIDDISLTQDEKTIELALSNLVHNAIKYSPENTTIELQVNQDQNKTTFKIIDNGIGIPENDQKNIFNRYFRAENALLNQGTGIGLNIVKTHLENLGGAIQFESKENIGSTFTITIPNTPN